MIEFKPYSDFETDELASAIHEMVKDNKSQLKSRRLLGFIARYGADFATAREKVEKGQRETEAGTLGHFAIVDEAGEISGQASVFPGLELQKLRVPVHPRVLPRKLKTSYSHASPNISAWTVEEKTHLLEPAYSELRKRAHSFIPSSGIRDIAWTIEPLTSPRFVHEAITASGLAKVATRFYYDGENRYVVGPGTLYAETSDWLTSRGRHQELMCGDWHGSIDEIMSRNPRGT